MSKYRNLGGQAVDVVFEDFRHRIAKPGKVFAVNTVIQGRLTLMKHAILLARLTAVLH